MVRPPIPLVNGHMGMMYVYLPGQEWSITNTEKREHDVLSMYSKFLSHVQYSKAVVVSSRVLGSQHNQKRDEPKKS